MKANLQPPNKPNSGKQPEFGDWRVKLERPNEAEHYHNPPLSMWKIAKLRLAQLESEDRKLKGRRPSKLKGHVHKVDVTYTPDHIENTTYDYDDAPAIVPLKGWKKVLRIIIGLLLMLPLSITLVYALALQLYHNLPTTAADNSFWLSSPIYYSILGIFTFIALIIAKFATPMLVYFYVLGHELTHALTALAFMGKVSTVNVDLDGGYIETDKDNVIIALAPYFVPLWMLVWVLLVSVLYLFLPEESVNPWFFGGAGFWWSFHIFWTIWVIPREQPDLLENEVMFSLLFVVIMNIIILTCILRFFNFITWSGYWQDFLACATSLLDTLQWLISLCFN